MNQPVHVLAALGATEESLEADSTAQDERPINVLQFICSTGFYGAEGWILALANNSNPTAVRHHLAVTREWESHDLELSRRFRHLDLPVHELKLSGKFDLRVIPQLLSLVREHRIDIIHTHGYKSDLLGVLVAKLSGIASVCTPHGFENTDDFKLRAYIRLGCLSFRFFDKVVPLSVELLSDVKRMHVKDSQIKYIANGVDLTPVEAIRQQRDSSRACHLSCTPVVGYIGQLIDRKNVNHIIEMLQSLVIAIPEVRLVIVGDGDCRSALEAQVKRLSLTDRVEFRGFVSNPLEHLKEFDLFVMCSSLEGIPRCLMESMAMGVPVVAYDIPGVDQLITHEVTGLLAPYADIVTLAELCERVLSDASLSESISHAALARVYELFSAKRMADAYQLLFRQLLLERAKRTITVKDEGL